MPGSNGTEPRSRVLVVEDETDIAALIAYELTRAGYRVETATTGRDALRAVEREVPDLIVLDRMLPEVSGDEVLRQVRSDASLGTLPVLMLTAKKEQEDRIQGLELGVDDYLTKPFSPRELVLRVQAILRRIREPAVDTGVRILRTGPLALNLSSHQVAYEGKELSVTPTEFRLLKALMERPGKTQSRRQLLQRAWDLDAAISDRIQTRTVDMHVRRLRAKLGRYEDIVRTVRGVGYRFDRHADVVIHYGHGTPSPDRF